MPKKVVYLVQELKAKSSQQVFEWLREVGYDVSQEGFGMMSEIDDETIVKLKAFATGKGKAVGPPKRIKRAAPTAEVAVPAAPPAPVTMRDFFKEEVAAEVAPVPQVEIPVVAPPPVPVAPPAPRLKSIIEDRPAGKKVKLTKTKKEEPKAEAAKVEVEPELDAVAEVEAVEEEVAVTERKREVKKDKPPVAVVDTRAKPKDRPYKISDGKNLYLFIMPNGRKVWRYRYRK